MSTFCVAVHRISISILSVLLLYDESFAGESEQEINCFQNQSDVSRLGLKLINVDCSKRMLHDLSPVLEWINQNISSLDFSHNYIEKIPRLPVLTRLKKLNFRNNNIKLVEERAFSDLRSLEILDLSFNFLKEIDWLRTAVLQENSTLPRPLPIKVLFLGFNRITVLNANAFEFLPHLQQLQLSGNPLKSAANDLDFLRAINSVTTLESLDLAKTGISSLPGWHLKDLTLKKLYINGNEFPEVPNLHYLSSLEFININENPVEELNRESFDGLVNLKEIVVSGMPNLTSIKAGTFSNLLNLLTLECSYNPELFYIDEEAFSTNPSYSIKNVFLTSNKIRHLPKNLLRWSQLDRLELDGNPWSCDCQTQWLINFENRRNQSIISFNDLMRF